MEIKEDIVQRVNIERIAHEDGEWRDAPNEDRLIWQTAIFESVFNYIKMAVDDSRLQGQMEISPEKIINAMMRRTEIEIVDALIKSYNSKVYENDDD